MKKPTPQEIAEKANKILVDAKIDFLLIVSNDDGSYERHAELPNHDPLIMAVLSAINKIAIKE